LTSSGRKLVDRVTARRRDEIARAVQALTPGERDLVLRAMSAFARAAGEPDVGDLAEFGV